MVNCWAPRWESAPLKAANRCAERLSCARIDHMATERLPFSSRAALRRAAATPTWWAAAACRGIDPDLFYPEGKKEEIEELVTETKTICVTCPVQRACLANALVCRETSGIWGGLTERERRKLARALDAGRILVPGASSRSGQM